MTYFGKIIYQISYESRSHFIAFSFIVLNFVRFKKKKIFLFFYLLFFSGHPHYIYISFALTAVPQI